jgi:hypothetical protein
MHNLLNTVFTPKDARNAQGNRSELLTSANFGLVPLYLYDVGKLRSYVLRYGLNANDLAIFVVSGGTLNGRSSLLPSTHGRAKGISEAYVFLMGVHHLERLRVAFDNLT